MNDDELIPPASLGRREFLTTAAVGTLGAMMAGCDPAPAEQLIPYVRRSPEVVPGLSQWYATAGLRDGWAIGLLAESREGRPIKIEGHPEHPYSLGATGAREQAMVLSLYHPDRLRDVSGAGEPRSWNAFEQTFGPSSTRSYVSRQGEGLWLWLPPSSSLLLARQLEALRERYPRAGIVFDPIGAPIHRWEGARRVFGRALDVDVDLARADRVVFLDANALVEGPAALRWARGWASRRVPGERMLRSYAFESAVTATGASCDHRLAIKPSEVGKVALALLAHVSVEQGVPVPADVPHPEAVEAVARDLAAHRGRSPVLVGDGQPAHVHVLGALLNVALGNVGEVVTYRESAILGAETRAFDPAAFFDALDAGAVDTLMTADVNPSFTHSGWAERVRAATIRVALSSYDDETAAEADWVLPSLHPLERWEIHRAYDGRPTAVQPLIRPLVPGGTASTLLGALLGQPIDARAECVSVIRDLTDEPFEVFLARGLMDRPYGAVRATADGRALDDAVRRIEAEQGGSVGLELHLRPDVRLGRGEDAGNAWLQELPEPNTHLVWDNAALLSPAEMERRRLRNGDLVELVGDGNRARLPAFAVEGQADGVVVAWLGFGRRSGERVARGVGVDLVPLLDVRTVTLHSTGGHYPLVRTQTHDRLDHPEQVLRRASLDEWRDNPTLAPEWEEHPPPSLYPDRTDRTVAAWAMAIDLNRCIGCKACVVACQAENDVPVVGKAQVARGREMHWLRIDRYLIDHGHRLTISYQPMLCQHCEKAPCEYVCPVNATVHSPDGLNEMIYNRCVGTRFCQNNCPWHVRRFNWFDYHADLDERQRLVFNPDLTVRGRGVMEKCTFCVQRIRRHPRYGSGTLKTACQQACPTETIVFGDLNDEEALVTHWRREPRAYSVLGELGTRPRVSYLARVDDDNPALRHLNRGTRGSEG